MNSLAAVGVMTHSWGQNSALWIPAAGPFRKKERTRIKGKILNFIQGWAIEIYNSSHLLIHPAQERTSSLPPPTWKPYCWKFHIWRSRWFSKHLPTDIFKTLASFLMSKVFFPTALSLVRVPVPLPVLFCLVAGRQTQARQGKYSPGRGRRGQGAKESLGNLARGGDRLRQPRGKWWAGDKIRAFRRR